MCRFHYKGKSEGGLLAETNGFIFRDKWFLSPCKLVCCSEISKHDYKEHNSFMSAKDVYQSKIKYPYDSKNKQNFAEMITSSIVEKIWGYRKENEPVRYAGRVGEVLKTKKENTMYKKFIVYYFVNEQNIVEINVYDKNRREYKLEQFIMQEEQKNSKLTKQKYDIYFEKEIGTNSKYMEKDYEFMKVKFSQDIKSIFEKIETRLDIVVPLTSFTELPYVFELNIKKLLSQQKNVNLYLCGIEYIDKHQRERIVKLKRILNQSPFGNVYSLKEYFPQSIVKDLEEGIIYSPSIYPINNGGIESRVVQYHTEDMSKEILMYFTEKVQNSGITKYEVVDVRNSLSEIKKNIYDLIIEIDDYLVNQNLGWSKEKNLSEIKRNIESIKLSNKEEYFLKFVKDLYIDLVESFKKFSKRSKGKNYFDQDFSEDFPELSECLNRIRVYRNLTAHDWLEKDMQNRYFKFIDKDFDGYCPFGIKNTYEVMQVSILQGLLSSLEKTKSELKNNVKPF